MICVYFSVQQKPKVCQQHRLKSLIDDVSKHNNALKRLYEDVDGTLKDELNSMRGSDISTFYRSVNVAAEYYKSFPNAEVESYDQVEIPVNVNFSGEEIFGKYLDLNSLHLQFSNIIRRENIEQDYLQYLERFNTFFYLPDNVKSTRQYAEYLDSLWNYLVDFFKRTNPLTDWHKIENDILTSFDSAESKVNIDATSKENSNIPQPLRLGMFNNAEELHALGMDRLKEALEALGLKCGGTLQDRAARLWSVRGKKMDDIPAALRAKPDNRRKTEAGLTSNHSKVSFTCVHRLYCFLY